MRETRERNQTTFRKISVTLILILLMILAAAYSLGLLYFRDRFLPGTRINGFYTEFKTVQQTEDLLDQEVQSYELAVYTRNNGIEGIKASDVGLHYQPDGQVAAWMEQQNTWLWFLSLGKIVYYRSEREVQYDDAAMEQAVRNLYCLQPQNQEPPTDAYVKKGSQGYEVVAEKEGTTLEYEKVLTAVQTAMVSAEPSIDLEELDCYQKPTIYSTDPVLQENIAFLEKISDVIITYDFADRTETVDDSLILTWVTTEEDGSLALDWDLVAAYVNSLAQKYDTIGSVRTFRKYDGTSIMIEGGDYGWMINPIQETQGLIDAIISGKTQVREPIYSYTGFSRDTNDIGYTYLEINLGTQKMVWYVNGQPQVETTIVSGTPGNSDTVTPVGVYSVQSKDSGVLEEREQSNVNLRLNFYWSYSIHDAPWRSDFSAGANVNNGTTGCIHVPYNAMQTVFSGIEVGTPVVIYQ